VQPGCIVGKNADAGTRPGITARAIADRLVGLLDRAPRDKGMAGTTPAMRRWSDTPFVAQAAFAFATWVAMASIRAGDRQS